MNNTEVPGGSPDVASVLKYIAEREENLSKYSDKLRQNVQRVFSIFGNSLYCQVCGQGRRVKDIVHEGHEFTPKIAVSIEIRSEAFYDDGDAKWYLDLDRQGLSFGVETPRGIGIRSAEEAPRKVLSEVVRTGTLTKFLHDVAEALQEESDEYQEVADMAERMAQAISSWSEP